MFFNLFIDVIIVLQHKIWRSIRDNYVRNRRKNNEACKSGSGASKKKKYIYEEQLRFLEKTMELRTTNTSIPEDPTLDNCSVDIESNGNNSGHENDEESVVEVTPTTSIKRASVNVKRCTRKSNFIEEKLVSFMEAHQPRQDLLIEDEDLSFFKSLLPTVRKLNADKKFTFRMQTMQILKNLQQGTSATIEARPNNFISFPPQQSTASYANTNTNYQPESRPSSTATYFSNFSPSYHSTDDSHSRAEYDRDNLQYSNLDLT